MLTIVPNMYGSVGMLQKLLNRGAYDVHVRLDRADLASAHASMRVVDCGFLSPVGFGVVNPGKRVLPRAIVGALARASKLPRMIDRVVTLPKWPILAPHLYCIAEAYAKTTTDRVPDAMSTVPPLSF